MQKLNLMQSDARNNEAMVYGAHKNEANPKSHTSRGNKPFAQKCTAIKYTLICLIGLWLISSCSPKISTTISRKYDILDYREEVSVFGLKEAVPKSAEKLGSLRIDDSGFTINCSFETVIEKARFEARKVGGNAIKITRHEKPNIRNSCHRIGADILRITDSEDDHDIIADLETEDAEKMSDKADYSHVKLAVNGGWSRHTASISDKIPSESRSYVEDLMNGFHYEIGGTYYFTEMIGVGLKFNEYRSKNSIENTQDNIKITFVGPIYSTRYLHAANKNAYWVDFGFGYLGYYNNARVASEAITIKGSTLGWYTGIGYDLGLSKNMALGIQITVISGILSDITYLSGGRSQTVKLEKDDRENLSRLDFSIGLRYNF